LAQGLAQVVGRSMRAWLILLLALAPAASAGPIVGGICYAMSFSACVAAGRGRMAFSCAGAALVACGPAKLAPTP